MLDLKDLDSPQIIELVKAQNQPKNTWIMGRGWDQNRWTNQQFPDKSLLKTIENPVYLVRVDGHAIWVNETALKLVQLAHDQPDPPGGQIVRDASGSATGVFIDTAMEPITKHMAKPKRERFRTLPRARHERGFKLWRYLVS